MFAMLFGLIDIMKSNRRIEEPWSFWVLVALELIVEFGLGWSFLKMFGSVLS